MKFIDKVRDILMKKNDSKIVSIQNEINSLEISNSEENEKINSISKEIEECSKKIKDLEKEKSSKDEINCYEELIKFLEVEPMIVKLTEEYKRSEKSEPLFKLKNAFSFDDEAVDAKSRIQKIEKDFLICETSRIDDVLYPNENTDLKLKNTKDNIISRFVNLFRKKDDKKLKKDNKNIQNPLNVFKMECENLNYYFWKFFKVGELGKDFNKFKIEIDKNIGLIKNLNNLKKFDDLREDEKIVYEELKPFSFWEQLDNHFNNIKKCMEISKLFIDKFEKYGELYEKDNSILDRDFLIKKIEDSKKIDENIKSLNKDEKNKRKENSNIKQSILENNKKIAKLKKNLEEANQISKKNLKELGFKTKLDAANKLNIQINDYIMIPIKRDVQNIEDIFDEKEKLKIEFSGKTYNAEYVKGVTKGNLNSSNVIDKNGGVLVIPVNYLKSENIDYVKGNDIYFNESVLNCEDTRLILAKEKSINCIKYNIDSKNVEDIKSELDDIIEYADRDENIYMYEIFAKASKNPRQPEINKNDTINECLVKNIKRNLTKSDNVFVNGQQYFITNNDEVEMLQEAGEQKIFINENKLEKICKTIQNSSFNIDEVYGELLKEYLAVKLKSKAEYYEEESTSCEFDKRNISFKPLLSSDDDIIAKKYTRKNEDRVYKNFKLASLINRFAHMSDEKSDIQEMLFKTKANLIEKAIDYSSNNPNVKLYKKFDDDKNVISVIVEIPNYNMIALHLMNRSNELDKKISNLEIYKDNIVNSSTIMQPGISIEFLERLGSLSPEQRKEFFSKLDSTTIKKLGIRMGLINYNISNENEKNEMIEEISTDDIFKRLREEDFEEEI